MIERVVRLKIAQNSILRNNFDFYSTIANAKNTNFHMVFIFLFHILLSCSIFHMNLCSKLQNYMLVTALWLSQQNISLIYLSIIVESDNGNLNIVIFIVWWELLDCAKRMSTISWESEIVEFCDSMSFESYLGGWVESQRRKFYGPT